MPFAAVIKVVMREAGRPRRERMDALRTVDEVSDGATRAITPTG